MDESKVRQVFAAIDRMAADEYVGYFSEDASFRFGNAEVVIGRPAIRDVVTGFWSTIESLYHDITGIWKGEWEQGEVYSVEAELVYTRKDGSVVRLPATSTLRLNRDRIKD